MVLKLDKKVLSILIDDNFGLVKSKSLFTFFFNKELSALMIMYLKETGSDSSSVFSQINVNNYSTIWL